MKLFFIIGLACNSAYPEKNVKNAAKILFRLLGIIPQWREITTYLDALSVEELRAWAQNSPGAPALIFKNYINRHWRISKKLDASIKHYRFAIEGTGQIFNMAPSEYINILSFGDDLMAARVVMDRPRWMNQEGEVALSIFLGIHRIYTCMFTIDASNGRGRLMIGAIQGRKENSEENNISQQFTKAFHGLRPRDFLMCVVQIFAGTMGCTEIFGISDDAHRIENTHTKSQKITSYDDIWKEYDGVLESDGFFSMTSEVRRREASDIPSKKRAMYRRRYELIDQMRENITTLIENRSWLVLVH